MGESSSATLPVSESGKDVFLLPKVGISIPIYRKKNTAMLNETVFQYDAALNKKTDKVNALETSFEKGYANYNDAERRITLHEKQLKLAGKSIKILETQYAVNGKDFEEILRMERQLLMHSLELEKSRADKNVAYAFIMYLIGK